MRTHRAMHGILLVILLAVCCQTAWAQDGEIVFIDLDRIFNDYHKTKLADQQLKDQAEEFNVERSEFVDEYQKLEEEFNATRAEAQNMALSEEVRAEKRDLAEEQLIELRKKERNIRRFEENRRKQLEEQQRRMRKRIVKELRDTIEVYAREKGFAAVFDLSGQSLNGVETVVYVDNKTDITDDILEELNMGKTVIDTKDEADAEDDTE